MRAWCQDLLNEPDLLTVKQAAWYLNVGDRTVYSLCADNNLRHYRIGNGRGTIRIRREDLDRYLEQNQVNVRSTEDVETDFLFD